MRRSNKLLCTATALAMAVGLGGAANAAQIFLVPPTTIEAGILGNAVNSDFTDFFQFTITTAGSLAADFTNNTTKTAYHKAGDLDFTSFTLTGPLSFLVTGTVDNFLNPAVVSNNAVGNCPALSATCYLKSTATLNATLVTPGTYTLTISGHSFATSPFESSYGGSITWDAAVVPEPAAWALMTVGFGGLGAMLRRRRSTMVHA